MGILAEASEKRLSSLTRDTHEEKAHLPLALLLPDPDAVVAAISSKQGGPS